MPRIEEEQTQSGDEPTPIDTENSQDEGTADLHVHTVHSDGVLSPVEVVERAREAGLHAVAITDHDNVAGIDEAMEWGKRLGVMVIPGLELSTSHGDRDIHILAYFMDHHDPELLEYLSFFRQERLRRAERIVQKLHGLNVPLDLDHVLAQAGVGSVGRPHIANALIEGGFINSFHEAFEKYIGTGGPAYETKFQLRPEQAIRLISSAGGLSFLAHPGRSLDESEIHELIRIGLDGIEVVHPSHGEGQREYFRGIISQYFLLECGGSDYHGGRKGDEHTFGKFTVPLRAVNAMRKRLFS